MAERDEPWEFRKILFIKENNYMARNVHSLIHNSCTTAHLVLLEALHMKFLSRKVVLVGVLLAGSMGSANAALVFSDEESAQAYSYISSNLVGGNDILNATLRALQERFPIDWSKWPHKDKPKPVPEPATLTLFGFGLLGIGLAARRRRNLGR